jgi:hypothetical protein
MPNLLKRVRQRFGISAPRMTVRTHLAWYWRWLGMLVFASLSLALALWMYDAGRRFAGFDRSELEAEAEQLRRSVARLEGERSRLRSIADASESRLKIEQSAQAQLVRQVKALEEDNRRLQEDLALFENLTPAGERVTINRFTVQPDALPGEYRYRMLVLLGGVRRDRNFQGSLQLVVNVRMQGRTATLVLPDARAAADPGFNLNFKYFQRVEGTFRVPADTRVESVQVRILENGAGQSRATQNAELS